MKWVDFLAWFFVIGVFLSWSFVIYMGIKFNEVFKEQREWYYKQLQQLRHYQDTERKDLLNRLMASSYQQYEEYKEGKPKKPKPAENFIKRSIDQSEQNYIRERQGLIDE